LGVLFAFIELPSVGRRSIPLSISADDYFKLRIGCLGTFMNAPSLSKSTPHPRAAPGPSSGTGGSSRRNWLISLLTRKSLRRRVPRPDDAQGGARVGQTTPRMDQHQAGPKTPAHARRPAPPPAPACPPAAPRCIGATWPAMPRSPAAMSPAVTRAIAVVVD